MQIRNLVEQIRFEHRRSVALGGVMAVLGYEPVTTLRPVPRSTPKGRPMPSPPAVATVPIRTELTFRGAGQATAQHYRVNDIERLVLSIIGTPTSHA